MFVFHCSTPFRCLDLDFKYPGEKLKRLMEFTAFRKNEAFLSKFDPRQHRMFDMSLIYDIKSWDQINF
jgi:hypothetical protein